MFNIPEIYENVRLVFDEAEHKYTDTLGNSYISTTTILHQFQPKFDKSYWLRKKSKELGISQKELARQWQTITDEACERGTNTHNGLENGIKGSSKFKSAVEHLKRKDGQMITVADMNQINDLTKPLDIKEFIECTENKYPDIYKVLSYYIERDYKIYSEIGVFLPEYRISGTIDVLCLREDRMVVGDWKTNRGGLKFESGYYKKDKSQKPAQQTNEWVRKSEGLLAPLNHLPNCNGSIYNLQLSVYAFMVETILGIPNAGLWLFHIDSDFELNEYGQPKRFSDGLYHIKENPIEKTTFHPMKYLRNEVIQIMNDRKKVVEADLIRNGKLF